MRILLFGAACAVPLLAAGTAAFAQRAADLPALDVASAVGEPGPGWVKRQTGEEGVTFVCESEACGGRGVLGLGQAKVTPDYVKEVVADPEKTLKSYRYATDESMRPSGCTFASYEIRRRGDRRVQYDSKGACSGGAAAAMTTIFDLDRPTMLSVQVLTGAEAKAVALRDASIEKIVTALDGGAAGK
ncbi:hypothetical protein [Hansschlegelia sp. KR7-227]|uniref:hypothetical protein n=1 Tax=Hansschlegelia sp. KR7-227 TaxID=3400914 RepID=UPI003C034E11